MKGVALLMLMAACGVTGTPSPTAQSNTATSSSFAANGAAVSEAVGPDGTKQGECAYSDNTGLSIKVRYVFRPDAEPEFVVVQGDKGQDPAEVYKTCMEAYRQSQTNAQSAFSMGFNPFFNPFFFDSFPFFPFSRSGGNLNEAAEPLNGAPSSRVDSFVNKMEAQNRALLQRNLQLQENLRRLEQENLEMQRRIMSQIGG